MGCAHWLQGMKLPHCLFCAAWHAILIWDEGLCLVDWKGWHRIDDGQVVMQRLEEARLLIYRCNSICC